MEAVLLAGYPRLVNTTNLQPSGHVGPSAHQVAANSAGLASE